MLGCTASDIYDRLLSQNVSELCNPRDKMCIVTSLIDVLEERSGLQ